MRFSMLGPFGFHPNKTMRSRALPLAQALTRRGHQVKMVLPPWQTPEEAGQRWQEGGVEIVNVSLQGGILPTVRRLLRESAAFQPQVVYSFKPKAHSGIAAWLLWQQRRLPGQRPFLLTDSDDWEGWGGWNDRAPYSPLQKQVFARQESWGLLHHDTLTVASRALETITLSLGVPSRKLLYLPNGSGLEHVPLDPQAAAAQREKLGLAARPILLLYSRLFESDLDLLTHILAGVHHHIPNLAILSIGSGLYAEDAAELRDRLAARGLLEQVVDLGWLPEKELPAALGAADVGLYLMADTLLNRAKCPVKLADLLRCGLPVVGEQVGQIPEYVVDHTTGRLCPPGDADGLTGALVDLLQDGTQRRQLGTTAVAHYRQHFAWDVQAARLENQLEQQEV